jgi:hypothetical protein
MAVDPTYVFKNDRIYAFANGDIIAQGDDEEEVEEGVKKFEEEEAKKSSSTIVTPNGMKGKILGRTPDMWGLSETLTVRLENGRIAHYKVGSVEKVADEKSEYVKPIVGFQAILAADVTATKPLLEERVATLKKLKNDVRQTIASGASDADAAELHHITVQADAELGEIQPILEDFNRQEAEATPQVAPYETQVVEQGGRSDGAGWLDTTLNEMIEEAEGHDYDKLLSEGPELFVAEQPVEALGDQGATQAIAASYIRSITAGADTEVRDKYEKAWLARVEEVRRDALTHKKTAQRKEASVKKETADSSPDESLFL